MLAGARAGRRATLSTIVPIDPLDVPAPVATSSGGGTDKPAWLDDDDSAVAPTPPSAVVAEQQRAKSPAASVVGLNDSFPDHRRATAVVSPTSTSAKEHEDVPPAAARGGTADGAASNTRTAPAPPLSPPSAANSASIPHSNVTQTTSAKGTVVGFNMNVGEDSTSSTSEAKIASLEQELWQLDEALKASSRSIESLESQAHEEYVTMNVVDQALEASRRQLLHAKETLERERASAAEQAAVLRERVQSQLAAFKAELHTAAAVQFSEHQTQMTTMIDAVEKSIALLRSDLKQEHGAVALDVLAQDLALEQLAGALRALAREERSRTRVASRNILQDESRTSIAEAAAERARLLDADREARLTAVRNHQTQRRRSFDSFRARRHDDRQCSADKLFGSLKVQMQKRSAEAKARSVSSLAAYRKRLEDDCTASRIEADQQADRLVARQRVDDAALEQQLTHLEDEQRSKLDSILQHTVHMLDLEIASAVRLRDAPRGAERLEDVATKAEASATMAIGSHEDALRARIRGLELDVVEFQQWIKTSRSDVQLPTEVSRLVAERESVLRELRQHMDTQRDALRSDWMRLESLILALSAKADAFEKSIRHGRSALTTAQVRLDQASEAWQVDARRQLHSAFDERSGGLPISSEALLNKVLFDVDGKLRRLRGALKETRAQRDTVLDTVVSQEEVVATKAQEVNRTTVKVIETVESLSKQTAVVMNKQEWLRCEENDLRQAQRVLEEDKSAFQEGVVIAQEIAERLRVASKDDQHRHPAHGSRVRPAHDFGLRWAPYEKRLQQQQPHAYGQHSSFWEAQRHAAPQHRQRHASGDFRAGGDDTSSSSEHKYRHLYHGGGGATAVQFSREGVSGEVSDLVGGGGAGRSMAFDSLVPLDDTTFHLHSASAMSARQQVGHNLDEPPRDVVGPEGSGGGSSGGRRGELNDPITSESTAAGGGGVDARRYSLPTPSSSTSGR